MSCCGGGHTKGNGAVSKKSGGCGCSGSGNCCSSAKRRIIIDDPSNLQNPASMKLHKDYNGCTDDRTTSRYPYKAEESAALNYINRKARNQWEDTTTTDYSDCDTRNEYYGYKNDYYDDYDASDDEYAQQSAARQNQNYTMRVGGGCDNPIIASEQDYPDYYYEHMPVDDQKPSTSRASRYNHYVNKYNQQFEHTYNPRRRVHF